MKHYRCLRCGYKWGSHNQRKPAECPSCKSLNWRFEAWVTPQRQQHLVELAVSSRGFCVFGHPKCPVDDHHYEVFVETVIGDGRLKIGSAATSSGS